MFEVEPASCSNSLSLTEYVTLAAKSTDWRRVVLGHVQDAELW